MPEEGIDLVPMEDVLSYEEIREVVRVAASMGLGACRLTGGEPLARKGLVDLVGMISALPGIEEVALTTNGIDRWRGMRNRWRGPASAASTSASTRCDRTAFAGSRAADGSDDVLDGIAAARAAGLTPVKLNVVVMRGVNDDEVVDFARSTLDEDWQVRFIELMPFTALENTGQQSASSEAFVSNRDVRQTDRGRRSARSSPTAATATAPRATTDCPARRARSASSARSREEGFCDRCNRMRLTATGKLRPCLLTDHEIDLLPLVARRRGRRGHPAGYNGGAVDQAGRTSSEGRQPSASSEDGADRRLRSHVTKLSHLDESGRARMVDVTSKDETVREAVATGTVRMQPSTLALIQSGGVPKGDVIAVAQVAGVMAAKRTPRSHPHVPPAPAHERRRRRSDPTSRKAHSRSRRPSEAQGRPASRWKR